MPDMPTPPCNWSPGQRAWTILFGALCFSAGNGLALALALVTLYGLPDLRELGGPRTALVVLWFAASIPLAALACVFRTRLLRWRGLSSLALGTTLVTLGSFAIYATKITLA